MPNPTTRNYTTVLLFNALFVISGKMTWLSLLPFVASFQQAAPGIIAHQGINGKLVEMVELFAG